MSMWRVLTSIQDHLAPPTQAPTPAPASLRPAASARHLFTLGLLLAAVGSVGVVMAREQSRAEP